MPLVSVSLHIPAISHGCYSPMFMYVKPYTVSTESEIGSNRESQFTETTMNVTFIFNSDHRKPFSNLTAASSRHSIPFSQSNNPKPSADPYMSDSSTGSTQFRNPLQYLIPQGDGNQMVCSRKQMMMKTRSKTKAAAVKHPFHFEKTKNDTRKSMNMKENVCIPLFGVNVHGINGNQIVVTPNCALVNNVHNERKVVPKPCSTGKMNGKGMEISVPTENTNVDALLGNFKDRGKELVVSSTPVNISKKYKQKEVVIPINFGALKKAKGSSYRPLLRIRREVKGVEDAIRTKSSAYPLSNDKEKKCLSKGRYKKYVPPQDFIDQQKAYFKEIDEYELDVEEVE